jgi:hypothetical protein
MFRKIVYVQVYSGYFVGRLMDGSGSIRRECPALAHPRTLAGDFSQIRAALSSVFKELDSRRMGLIKPHVLIHLVPKAEGGYTNVELRAFKDAAEGAGAAMGWLLGDSYGPLTDRQVTEAIGNLS